MSPLLLARLADEWELGWAGEYSRMSWPCQMYTRRVLGFWWKKRRMIGESGVEWGESDGVGGERGEERGCVMEGLVAGA